VSDPAPSPTRLARCPACHYDLSGTSDDREQDRCPECGASLHADALAHARERRFFQRLARHLITALVVLTITLTLIIVLFPAQRVIVIPILILAVGASAPAIMAVMSREV
jgi:hypothetical protein